VECETLEKSADHMFTELKGHMDELADPSGLKPNSFIRRAHACLCSLLLVQQHQALICLRGEESNDLHFELMLGFTAASFSACDV